MSIFRQIDALSPWGEPWELGLCLSAPGSGPWLYIDIYSSIIIYVYDCITLYVITLYIICQHIISFYILCNSL